MGTWLADNFCFDSPLPNNPILTCVPANTPADHDSEQMSLAREVNLLFRGGQLTVQVT
jgi:hypothetical protein